MKDLLFDFLRNPFFLTFKSFLNALIGILLDTFLQINFTCLKLIRETKILRDLEKSLDQ